MTLRSYHTSNLSFTALETIRLLVKISHSFLAILTNYSEAKVKCRMVCFGRDLLCL